MENKSNSENLPLVSIMIPTFNREKYIERCILSVLDQEYTNLEIIISDNASNDRTSEIVQKYINDKRIIYHRNSENIGLFNNWIKLLYELASGEFGLFLPDDDYLIDKKHISKAIELVQKFNVHYIFTDSIWIDEIQRTVTDKNFDLPPLLTPEWAVNHIGKRIKPSNSFFAPGLPSFFNIRIAKELKILIPGCAGFDGEMGMRFMFSGNTAYLNGAQRAATTHPNSAGNTDTLDNIYEGLYIYKRMVAFGLERNLGKKALLKFQNRMVILHVKTLVLPIWKNYKGIHLLSVVKLYLNIFKIIKYKFTLKIALRTVFSFEIFAKIITLKYPIVTKKK